MRKYSLNVNDSPSCIILTVGVDRSGGKSIGSKMDISSTFWLQKNVLDFQNKVKPKVGIEPFCCTLYRNAEFINSHTCLNLHAFEFHIPSLDTLVRPVIKLKTWPWDCESPKISLNVIILMVWLLRDHNFDGAQAMKNWVFRTAVVIIGWSRNK